jgi:TPR repeat protein
MAQDNLGLCFEFGRGVGADDTEAAKWFRKSAEQGYPNAQNNLGGFYERGRSVPHDDAEAAKWYQKAAEQGYAPAQNNLGLLYMSGRGVPKDEVKAYQWLNLSAEQETQEAIVTLRDLETHMTKAQISEGQRLSREFKARQIPAPK